MLRDECYDPETPYTPNPKYVSPYKVDFKNPDYGEIFKIRAERLDVIRSDGTWDLVKRYYADGNTCAFIEDWLCTFDPRLSARGLPTTVPLILFPRQVEYVELLDECYHSGQDLTVGKSRDMGVSVVTLAWATHKLLFLPGTKISVGSRKEDLVDKIGNSDSLLEKVRQFLRFLPMELLPPGYSERKHARHLNITNPQNGSSITGEAGDNIGRGGRSSAYIVDEAAFLERPESIDAALSQNCNMRIDVSTPNGPVNPFANKWFENEMVKAFAFHWTMDPRKDKEWYDKECKRLQDPRTIAQELDLSFNTSGEESVVHAQWIKSSIDLRVYLESINDLPPKVHGIAGCDVGGGVAQNTYVPRWGPLVGNVVAWVDADTTRTAEKFAALAKTQNIELIKYDSIGVGRGVASTMKRLPVKSQAVDVGKSPSNTVWPDNKKAKDKFNRLKAELWWIVRDRLQKTHDHWCWLNDPMTGKQHKIEDLLLLPEDEPELTRQLATPGYKVLETGKIQIETKAEMLKRGVLSPDQAEAVIVSFSPVIMPPVYRRAVGAV